MIFTKHIKNNKKTETAAKRATVQSTLLFDEENVFSLSAPDIVVAFESDPRFVRVPREEVIGQDLVLVLAKTGAAKSKSNSIMLRCIHLVRWLT